ncbi:thioredoxin-dependent thiol peroxidase [Sinomonas sp. ASV322]|uniref:thioredoxin-dependent thiol peroxidase n=1 Tax=Sinomonas sp. ASV322 TaxID=3041920 RepID=UPI0027DCDAAE|nr:thioredoxin-dependent thiol peroxidase [Sinomonas sp. ASV322]MDQ4502153.1 thioredoxin-dependent thiol peroxidase [Sinomonas sp. ASV322]
MTTSAAPFRLASGDPAPDFSLPDSDGGTTALADLRGRKAVLYFYPEADTPACTQQACDFRDSLASLAGAGYAVVGISPDPARAVVKFADEQRLGFPLLADEGHAVADLYGTWGEKKNYGRTYQGLIRSTFVIDEEGRIALAQYNVRAKGHVAKLRRDLRTAESAMGHH